MGYERVLNNVVGGFEGKYHHLNYYGYDFLSIRGIPFFEAVHGFTIKTRYCLKSFHQALITNQLIDKSQLKESNCRIEE